MNVGPFIDATLGRYAVEDGNEVADTRGHEWITIGLRLVAFP